MKKATVIPTVSVLIALVCAALFCLNWNPEPLLKGKEQPVTLSDIEQNLTTDFNGFPAGEDIPRLTSAEDFSEIRLCDRGTSGDCRNRYFQPETMRRSILYAKSQGQSNRTSNSSAGNHFIWLGFAGQLSAILPVGASGSYLYRGTNSAANSEGNRKGRKRHTSCR